MKKKYKKPQSSRTFNKPAQKTIPQNPINKNLIIAGATALVTTILFTAILIWFYGDTTVARINDIRIRGNEVSNEIARDHNIQQMIDFGMMTWEEASESAARQLAFNRLLEDYARQYGISLTGNETPAMLMESITDAIIADTALFANFEAYMAEDEIPSAERRAAEILARALAGEDFDTLVATYGEDPGMQASPEGYAFIQGAMVLEFCEATRELEIGEISGLVQTTFGFHIIKRVEPPENPASILTPLGAVPPPLETDDEILGAKHILIGARETTPEQRMREAVSLGFTTQLEAGLVFLSGLSDIPRP